MLDGNLPQRGAVDLVSGDALRSAALEGRVLLPPGLDFHTRVRPVQLADLVARRRVLVIGSLFLQGHLFMQEAVEAVRAGCVHPLVVQMLVV